MLKLGRTFTLDQAQDSSLKRILVTLELLLSLLRLKSNITLSFSKKKCKTKPLTLNTFNPFFMNLKKKKPKKNLISFGFFIKTSSIS